jgi:hypothetical protein
VDARGEIKLIGSEVLPVSSIWQNAVHKARIRIPVSTLEDSKVEQFAFLLQRYPGKCALEFELLKKKNCTIHVIPAEAVSVNPVPEFVRQVESLFGEKSCILDIQR